MKKFLEIVIFSLLLSGNAYSKVTNLICKLDKDNKPFPIILDNENKNATWHDKNVKANFSATAVKFIVATVEQSKGIYVIIDYEISRVNLDVIQTITMTVPAMKEIEDKIISVDKGKCEIGKEVETKF